MATINSISRAETFHAWKINNNTEGRLHKYTVIILQICKKENINRVSTLVNTHTAHKANLPPYRPINYYYCSTRKQPSSLAQLRLGIKSHDPHHHRPRRAKYIRKSRDAVCRLDEAEWKFTARAHRCNRARARALVSTGARGVTCAPRAAGKSEKTRKSGWWLYGCVRVRV